LEENGGGGEKRTDSKKVQKYRPVQLVTATNPTQAFQEKLPARKKANFGEHLKKIGGVSPNRGKPGPGGPKNQLKKKED